MIVGHGTKQLSLSEAINLMGLLKNRIEAEPDAVLAAAWRKLRDAAGAYAVKHPEELEAVEAELGARELFE